MPSVKVCSNCHEEKSIDQFDVGYTGRVNSYCVACGPAVRAERKRRKDALKREWAKANPDKVKASQRATYEKNREERLKYLSRWRRDNREHVQEYQRGYQRKKAG